MISVKGAGGVVPDYTVEYGYYVGDEYSTTSGLHEIATVNKKRNTFKLFASAGSSTK